MCFRFDGHYVCSTVVTVLRDLRNSEGGHSHPLTPVPYDQVRIVIQIRSKTNDLALCL